MLLSVANLSKTYGDHTVLAGITLTVHTGDRWGVVGANGSGKSTLIKCIVGAVEPDAGTVVIPPGITVGYLPQVLDSVAGQTISDVLAAALEQVHALEARLRALEGELAGGLEGQELEAALGEYGRLADEYERLGGYALDSRIDAVLAGLDVAALPRDRCIETLSGGEKARVGLAALLLRAPDLLLLDEPTNHLDFAALGWLETYLAGYGGGLLVVSHDRTFLNATVTAILELDEQTHAAVPYGGDYDFFAAAKALALARQREQYQTQQEEIRELRRFIHSGARQVAHNRPATDGDKFYYSFKGARVDATVARNVRSAEEKLRRLEAEAVPKPPQPLRILTDFDPKHLVNRTPLALSQVRMGYGDRLLLDDVTVAVGANDRIVIVGANGSGKSTLLKLMARRIQPDSGSVTLAASTAVGYLDQEQETLPTAGTLYDAYVGETASGPPGSPPGSPAWEERKAELLRYGLFTWPDLLKPIGGLSVGQRRKLQLAQLIAARANLLLLDEPTNHISFDVLEAFEQALVEFPGAIIAVSHDRRLLSRLSAQLWELRDGRLIRYLGGWEQYRQAERTFSPAGPSGPGRSPIP